MPYGIWETKKRLEMKTGDWPIFFWLGTSIGDPKIEKTKKNRGNANKYQHSRV